MSLICISLIIVMMNMFSYSCWSFVCLPLRKCLFSSSTHFLIGLFGGFWYWVCMYELLLCFGCVCVHAQSLSCAWLFVVPWTVPCQAPLSMEFFRQEYWSSLPFPPPGDLPDSGVEPTYLVSPVLAGGFFTTVPPGRHLYFGY